MDKPAVIKVAGAATLRVAPDLNRIKIRVERIFVSNDQAYECAKENSLAIIAALESVGLDGSLAKTTRFDICENSKPVYEKGRLTGYQKNGYVLKQNLYIDLPVENRRLNEINKSITEHVPFVEIELDTLLSNPREHRMKALSSAVMDAKERAETIAVTLGCRLGAILEVDYGRTGSDFLYDRVCDSAECSLPGAGLELTGEEEQIDESVMVVWQLVNP